MQTRSYSDKDVKAAIRRSYAKRGFEVSKIRKMMDGHLSVSFRDGKGPMGVPRVVHGDLALLQMLLEP